VLITRQRVGDVRALWTAYEISPSGQTCPSVVSLEAPPRPLPSSMTRDDE